jgi:hypothetical protein
MMTATNTILPDFAGTGRAKPYGTVLKNQTIGRKRSDVIFEDNAYPTLKPTSHVFGETAARKTKSATATSLVT